MIEKALFRFERNLLSRSNEARKMNPGFFLSKNDHDKKKRG